MSSEWHLFFPPGARVLALPSWQNPRLYLPAQGGLIQRWEGSSFYPAFRFRAKFYRALIRVRAATGLVAVRTARSSDWPLGEFTQEMLPKVTSAIVLVGTPGPVQKSTVQLRGEKGRVLGYLKYAEKEAARNRLRQERRLLPDLPEEVGPTLLKYGTLGNGEALLTTPLSGKPLPATLPPNASLGDFCMALDVLPAVPIATHPWVKRTRDRSEIDLDPWFETLAGKDWPVVIHHGDFAPWNLLRRPNGRLAAIDWESGSMEGFPYLDLAHYILKASALIYRWSPSKAAEYTINYLSLQPQFALSSAEARALVFLAAYSIYCKLQEEMWLPPASAEELRNLQYWPAIWKGSVYAG